jgi:hypothetical protein
LPGNVTYYLFIKKNEHRINYIICCKKNGNLYNRLEKNRLIAGMETSVRVKFPSLNEFISTKITTDAEKDCFYNFNNDNYPKFP